MRIGIAGLVGCLSLVALAVADPAIAAMRKSTHIPAESLGVALKDFARSRDIQVLYLADTVRNLRTEGATGELTTDEALTQILSGTGLTFRYVSDKAVTILSISASDRAGDPIQTQTSPASHDGGEPNPQEGSGKKSSQDFRVAQAIPDQAAQGPSVAQSSDGTTKKEKQAVQLQEVVVTGTLIHDVAPITPITTITQADLITQGYTTLADAIFDLPQNFQGAGTSPSSSTVNGIGGSNAAYNSTFASGINLRGLGGNATLVMLNGRRLAPTAYGATVDISQIPVSIIDRVEVLTDGASALYGSDAVAGVVNIITKRDYSGFEIGARSTDISEGKTPAYGADMVGGDSWGTGGFVASADYQKDNSLFARNRSFAATLPDPWAITPEDEAIRAYGSVHQFITDQLTFYTDVLFTHRDFSSLNNQIFNPVPQVDGGTVKQYSISPELDYAITSDWTASLIGQWSKEQDYIAIGIPGSIEETPISYQVGSIEPRVDGKVFALPGGAVRVAIGAQAREEKFDLQTLSNGQLAQTSDSSRHVSSVYGELTVPIISRENAVALARDLRVDISGRYDHYSDFGGTTNPKAGVSWTPVDDLTVHGTYSRSFQAPTLNDLYQPSLFSFVTPAADPSSATGSSLALYEFAFGNRSLQPETAKSFNAGLTFQPSYLSGFKLDADYFYITFSNEIVTLANEVCTAAYFCTLQDEAALGPFFQRNPSLAQVEALLDNPNNPPFNWAAGTFSPAPYTASDIKAIGNLGLVNAAQTVVRGIDLTPRYLGPDTPYGRFRTDLNASYYLRYEQSVTASSPAISIDNTYGNPLRFRAKVNVGWDKSGWAANARLNYANAYTNTAGVSCPLDCPGISSWTTVDLGLSYAVPSAVETSWLSGTRIALIVSNVFNRNPPVANTASPNYGYDPVNANPLLRSFSVTFTKHFGAGAAK